MRQSRIFFILFIFLWLSTFNILIINKIDSNDNIYNSITGEVINAGSYNEPFLPLLIINVTIVSLFIISYFEWENKHKKLIKKKR